MSNGLVGSTRRPRRGEHGRSSRVPSVGPRSGPVWQYREVSVQSSLFYRSFRDGGIGRYPRTIAAGPHGRVGSSVGPRVNPGHETIMFYRPRSGVWFPPANHRLARLSSQRGAPAPLFARLRHLHPSWRTSERGPSPPIVATTRRRSVGRGRADRAHRDGRPRASMTMPRSLDRPGRHRTDRPVSSQPSDPQNP